MNSRKMKAWAAPKLETIEMISTSSKTLAGNESGQGTCGPAQGGGAQDKCS